MYQHSQHSKATLSDSHRRMLYDESGISPDVAAARGYRTIRRSSEVPEAFKYWQRRLGLLVPTLSPSGELGHQLRPHKPIRRKKDGSAPKYETPAGSRITLDVNPLMLDEVRHGDGDLWATEGCKKVDALASRGEPAVGFIGVWSMAVPKTKGTVPLPCWRHVKLTGRRVIIVFDADARTNPDVQEALRRAVRMLEGLRAIVLVIYLPPVNGDGKAGVDDYLAAGGTVAELRMMAGPYVPVDVGAERLSRDERLQATINDLWRAWRGYDWMRFVGAGEHPNWQRGHTLRDVLESLIELGERSGKVDERSVVVTASHRLLVEMSAKSRPSVRAALKHAEAEGLLEVLEPEGEGKPRSYRLLAHRATLYHKGEGGADGGKATPPLQASDPGGKGLRAPTARRLGWSSPARKVRRLRGVTPGTRRVRQTRRFHKDIIMEESRNHFPDTPFIKRLGPHRCAVLDALEAVGGTLTLRELCGVLHRSRPRDVGRRILPMLQKAGIIEVEGDVITLAADWLARLEEERERTGEISRAEEQREEHRKQRERYRDYLRGVERLPSKASSNAIKKGHAARGEGLAAMAERATAVAETEELRRAGAFVQDRLRELGRIRLELLQDIWRDEGGDPWSIPCAVEALGYRVEKLPEFGNQRFVFAPAKHAA